MFHFNFHAVLKKRLDAMPYYVTKAKGKYIYRFHFYDKTMAVREDNCLPYLEYVPEELKR